MNLVSILTILLKKALFCLLEPIFKLFLDGDYMLLLNLLLTKRKEKVKKVSIYITLNQGSPSFLFVYWLVRNLGEMYGFANF